jgi:hypothetical protein
MLIIWDVFGLALGTLCFATYAYLVLTQTGLLVNKCGSVHGRTCNSPWGACNPDTGLCECDVTFSGALCTETLCPGYDNVLGTVCNARGPCSPFMLPADVLPACLDSWDGPQCATGVATQRAAGLLLGVPQCTCRGNWDGLDCTDDMCPLGVTGAICSGNGNPNVNFTNNYTTNGQGCQCKNRINFLSAAFLNTLSFDALRLVETRYYQEFREVYCGKTLGATVLQGAASNATCFCDDYHHGISCEAGSCPAVNGVPCGGAGHPAFGQGIERNTTRQTSTNGQACAPLCAPGLVACPGAGCQSSCAYADACPPTKPWRCSSGRCAAAPAAVCPAGSQSGWLDRLDLARGRYLNATQYNLSSPLVFYSFFGPGGFLYQGQPVTGAAGRSTHGLLAQQYPDLQDWRSSGWQVEWLSLLDGVVELWPAPFRYTAALPFAAFRLQAGTRLAVLDAISSRAVLSPFNASLLGEVVVQDALGILRPTGDHVAIDVCINDLAICVWQWDGLRLFQGQSRLWPDNLTLQFVDTYFSGRLRTPVNSVLNASWDLQLPFVQSAFLVDVLPGTSFLELVTVNDLSMPCACPPDFGFAVNRSDQDALWLADPSRVTGTGELAAVPYRLQGDFVPVRAAVLARDDVRAVVSAPGWGQFNVSLPDLHTLSPAEFASGLPTCDPRVFPVRCPSGACGLLVDHQEVVNETCACTGALAGTTLCACSSFSCACTPAACDCPDPVFALDLFAQLALKSGCACAVLNQTLSTGSSLGAWNGSLWTVPALGEILEVQIPGNVSAAVYAGNDALPFTSILRDNVTYLEPAAPWLQWLQYTRFAIDAPSQPLVVWFPGGVPVYRLNETITVTASSGANPEAVTALDHTTWLATAAGASWLEQGFARPHHLTRVMLVIKTAGLAFGAGALPVLLDVKAFDGTHWRVVAQYKSRAVGGTDAAILTPSDPGPFSALRIESYAPMELRSFIAYTDQECQCRALVTPKPAPLPIDQGTCVCDDSCQYLVGNVTVQAGADGICDDARSVGPRLGNVQSWIYVNKGTVSLLDQYLSLYNATGQVALLQGLARQVLVVWSPALVTAPNDTFGALLDNASSPEPGYLFYAYVGTRAYPVTASETDMDVANLTGASYTVFSYEFVWNKDGVPMPLSTVCADGTDCSDCGHSLRQQPLQPGVPCPTPDTLAHFPAMSLFLDPIPRLRQNISLACPGVCPAARCPDGSCATGTCPPTRYDCPGNGCLRADNDNFYCVCRPGRGGQACGLAACDPASPDPYARCTAYGPPPLKMQPGASLIGRAVSKAEVVAMNNQLFPVNNSNGLYDVRDLFVRPTFSQAWVPFLNRDCPPAVRGPLGQYLLRKDCVETENEFGQAVTWRTFYTLNGSAMQFVWPNLYAYDDFPVRCKNNARCVNNRQDCLVLDGVFPPGNYHGKQLVDGSVLCDPGWTTFLYTAAFTAGAELPYDAANPTSGAFNSNWRDYALQVCTKRDCGVQDCSPPTGCFAGTPSLNLVDRHVKCSAVSGHPGQCAPNEAMCVRGEVTAPLLCSGNGILRKREYRDEYYCACGSPASRLVDDVSKVKQITELVPNGFGGDKCDQYNCAAKTNYYFSTTDPVTGRPYFDNEDVALPGKWLGACGAPIGPSPDDQVIWSKCCPGVDRLERCAYVPCLIAGSTSCVLSHKCVESGGFPLVCPCNCKGTARGDGTCQCQANQVTGVGYTYNLELFSYKGCYQRGSCGVSRATGTVCNGFPVCDTSKWIAFPKVPYFEQQRFGVLFRDGLPLTNESWVRALTDDYDLMDSLLVSALVQIALKVQAAVSALAACICVYPGEDGSAAPFGMVQPAAGAPRTLVYPYLKSFRSPYQLALANVTFAGTGPDLAFLHDGAFYTNPARMALGVDYVVVESHVTPLIVQFAGPVNVAIVRIHAQAPLASRISVSFPDGSACPSTAAITPPGESFVWAGTGNAIYCTATYQDLDFAAYDSAGYSSNCADAKSPACAAWKAGACLASGNLVPASNDYFQGCLLKECCVPNQAGIANMQTSMIVAITGSNPPVFIDELRVFGYTDSVLPIPDFLQQEMAVHRADTPCADEHFFKSTNIVDKDFFLPPQPSQPVNQQVCVAHGGWLAVPTSSGNVDVHTMTTRCENGSITGNECFVGARNRIDPPLPLLSDFITPACSVFGCWIRDPLDPTKDVYATAGAGAQWQSDVSGLLTPWPTVAAANPPTGTWTSGADFCDITFYESGFYNGPCSSIVPPICGANSVGRKYVLHFGPDNDFRVNLGGVNYGPNQAIPIPSTLMYTTDCAQGWTLADAAAISNACSYTGAITTTSCAGFVQFGQTGLYGPRSVIDNTDSIGVRGNACAGFTLTNSGGAVMLSNSVRHNYDAIASVITDANLALWASWKWDYVDVCYINELGRFVSVATALAPASKLQLNLRAPAQQQSPGTDQFNLGYTQFPFMCQNVDVWLVATVAGGAQAPVQLTDNAVPVQWRGPAHIAQADVDAAFAGKLVPCNKIVQCEQCPVAQAIGNYEWDDHSVSPSTNFFQVNVDEFQHAPVMYLHWFDSGATPVAEHSFYLLTDLLLVNLRSYVYPTAAAQAACQAQCIIAHAFGIITAPQMQQCEQNCAAATGVQTTRTPALVRTYARLLCDVTIAQYRTRFFFDQCVTVRGSAFLPAICEQPRDSVCIRDVVRYQVQDGRQCDACGPADRAPDITPGQTCFALYSLADPAQFPWEHSVLDKYLAGTLNLVPDPNPAKYDATAQFIADGATSAIFSYPGFFDLAGAGYSDRPGRLAPQGTLPSLTWIDANLRGMFPVESQAPQCSKQTGKCGPRCATRAEYLSPDAPQFAGADMARSAYPSYLLPIAASADPVTTAGCGVAINPALYAADYSTSLVQVISSDADVVSLRFQASSARWYSLSKSYYLFAPASEVWVSGLFTLGCPANLCPGAYVALWIAPRSVLGNITSIVYVGNVSLAQLATSFSFNFTVPDDGFTYQVLGFDLQNFRAEASVTLSTVLVTDPARIAECMHRNFTAVLVEPPSSVDSGVPVNLCIFNEVDRDFYNAPSVGTCLCSKAQAGDRCEYPGLALSYAPGRTALKAICGGSGDGGRALLAAGGSAAVEQEGAYFDGAAFQCKCKDPGKMMQSRFWPSSAFAARFILRNDADPNAALYTVTNGTVLAVEADLTCHGLGATLPSWVNSEEQRRYFALGALGPSVVDLTIAGDQLVWGEREAPFAPVAGGVLEDPCPHSAVCDAVNWNNLAYGSWGLLADGGYASYTFNQTSITLVLRGNTGPGAWAVEITTDEDDTVVAGWSLGDGLTATCTGLGGVPYVYACTGDTTQLTISATTLTLSTARELKVFNDAARM